MCFCATSVAMELSAATAINSAICGPTSIRAWLLIADPQLLQRRVRTAVPLVEKHIALILQILDAHLRRPETARGEIAEAVEERDFAAQSRVAIRRVRDLVEDRA